ncbi:MAG: metallophosphoesterase [Planctomycetaceae bacterium]|nr:metallophosphoesterase [Planctomycetaceae bacterium]
MTRIILPLIAFYLLTAASRSFAAASVPNTWTGVERIVAVGDVHGAYDEFVSALSAAGVIDAKGDWIGGRTHLVQTGDIVDRGDHSRRCMDLMMKLETQAAAAGGMVHQLLGNHEVMVMQHTYLYTSASDFASFGGRSGLKSALGPAGRYGRWLRSRNAVIKINDVLFVHGGIPGKYASRSLDELNDAIRSRIDAGWSLGGLLGRGGPLWYRGWTSKNASSVADRCKDAFAAYDVQHAVVGHTTDGIATFGSGRVILIDSAMTPDLKGEPSALVIEKGVFTAVYPARAKEALNVHYYRANVAAAPAAHRP